MAHIRDFTSSRCGGNPGTFATRAQIKSEAAIIVKTWHQPQLFQKWLRATAIIVE
jgi:hypothetical protein